MPAGRDAAEAVLPGEPERSVGPGRDRIGTAEHRLGKLELPDGASRRDSADPAAVVREPEVAVRAGCDVSGLAVGPQAGGELRDHSRRRDPADPGRVGREPEIAVRPGGDVGRMRGHPLREVPDLTVRGEPPDRALPELGEPQRAVGASYGGQQPRFLDGAGHASSVGHVHDPDRVDNPDVAIGTGGDRSRRVEERRVRRCVCRGCRCRAAGEREGECRDSDQHTCANSSRAHLPANTGRPLE